MLAGYNIFDAIQQTLSNMRPADWVDILVVALIVYNVIWLVKGTRSGQVLIGLGLVLAINFLAGYFELLTLRFLMSNFMANIFTVLVILFATDIRRGLARAGRFTFSSKTSSAVYDAINEVVRAAFFMAERRVCSHYEINAIIGK